MEEEAKDENLRQAQLMTLHKNAIIDHEETSTQHNFSLSQNEVTALQNKLLSVRIPFPNFGKSAPEKILVFRWGKNALDGGEVVLDATTASEMVDYFISQGNLIPWDIDHANSRNGSVEEKRSYAFSSMDIDEEGLWLKTAWTDAGKHLVESGGYSYFSPSVKGVVRGSVMYPSRLFHMTITNNPLLKKLQPLLMSKDLKTMADTIPVPNEQLLTKVRPLREMNHAVASLMSSVQSCMGFYGNSSLPHPGLKDLSENMISVIPGWLHSIGEMLEMLDPQGESMEAENETKPQVASYSEDVRATDSSNERAEELDAVYSLKDLCAKLTGKTDLDEIKGALLAMSYNQSAYRDQVKTVEKSKVALMVDMGIKEGKIPAHERQMFEEMSEKTVAAHLSMAISKPSAFIQDVSLSKEDESLISMSKGQKIDMEKVNKDWERILLAHKAQKGNL